MPYADPERQRAYQRAYHRTYGRSEARRAYWRSYRRSYRLALRLEAFDAYGGPVCARCGSAERLQLDHVNGDGAQHRQRLVGNKRLGGHMFYSALKRLGWPNDPPLQVLCLACNNRKR